jgi:geranylgeranyl pyrophosphate synthase
VTAELATLRDTPGLTAFLQDVEVRLAASVDAYPGLVAAIGREALSAGGKRLRPLLCYLAAPTDRKPPYEAALAVELIHMATLVHDDQLDAAPLRRGRPTVWATHGPGVASATGDYLFARAFAELTATGEMPAVAILSDACLALAQGEILQREQAGSPDTTVDQYLARCLLKTGRLFAAAAMLGGRLGGADGDALAVLDRFGRALGLAFQIADDILDCDGDPQTTGKPLGTDLLDGTVTLPLILAAERDPQVREVILRGAQPEDVLPTLNRVVASGALVEARVHARRHADQAEAALDEVAAIVEADLLRQAVRGAVDRSS